LSFMTSLSGSSREAAGSVLGKQPGSGSRPLLRPWLTDNYHRNPEMQGFCRLLLFPAFPGALTENLRMKSEFVNRG
jgi:hypothetical protein